MELLETEVRLMRGGSESSSMSSLTNLNMSEGEMKRQAKEILILKRTIEEMEIRIDTQKSTLAARDESIKKLLEMLQNKGLATQQLEEDRRENDQLRQMLAEEERKRHRLETMLDDRDREMEQLKAVSSILNIGPGFLIIVYLLVSICSISTKSLCQIHIRMCDSSLHILD